MTISDRVRFARVLSDQIKPILAGQGSDIQGMVLADLVSMHIAGHFVKNDARQTQWLRDRMLVALVTTITQLVDASYARRS